LVYKGNKSFVYDEKFVEIYLQVVMKNIFYPTKTKMTTVQDRVHQVAASQTPVTELLVTLAE